MARFEVLVPVLTMTLIFCGMGSVTMLGSAELPPGHDEFAMSEVVAAGFPASESGSEVRVGDKTLLRLKMRWCCRLGNYK